jgi:hypothetical protein
VLLRPTTPVESLRVRPLAVRLACTAIFLFFNHSKHMLPQRVIYSCVLFTCVMVALAATRPRALFDHTGRPRPFGTGPDRTVLSLGVLAAAAAVVGLFAFTWIDVVFSRRAVFI